MKRLKTYVAAAALLFGTQAMAVTPEQMAQAAKALDICVADMPNSKKAKENLKKAGFRYESTDGSFHFYSFNGRRVLVGTSTTSNKNQGCLVSVSKMKPAEATELATPIIKKTKSKDLNFSDRDTVSAWGGTTKGRETFILIDKKMDLGYMRGAGVLYFVQ